MKWQILEQDLWFFSRCFALNDVNFSHRKGGRWSLRGCWVDRKSQPIKMRSQKKTSRARIRSIFMRTTDCLHMFMRWCSQPSIAWLYVSSNQLTFLGQLSWSANLEQLFNKNRHIWEINKDVLPSPLFLGETRKYPTFIYHDSKKKLEMSDLEKKADVLKSLNSKSFWCLKSELLDVAWILRREFIIIRRSKMTS